VTPWADDVRLTYPDGKSIRPSEFHVQALVDGKQVERIFTQ